MLKQNNSDYYCNKHSCFLLQYHLVLVTKYRHKVIVGIWNRFYTHTFNAILLNVGCGWWK